MYLPNNRTQLDAVPAQASKQAAHDSLRGFPRVRLFGALFCCLALTGCPCDFWLVKTGCESDKKNSPPLALAAPANVTATPGNLQVTVEWDVVPDATGYDLCYAEESITDFANCAAFMGGTLVPGVTSPHVVMGLTNGTQYFFRVVATLNADESPASAEVTATPAFTPVGGLNDTGITLCGDYAFDGSGSHQNNLDCAAVNATATTAGTDGDGDPVPAGQDAHFGRDAQALAGTLTKTGAGAAGFDYSKVCNSGEIEGEGACPANPPLGTGPNDWACTRDNVSGLIWEVKVNDNTQLRHQNHSYSWYNTDPATNGGSNGTQSGGSCNGDCDTQGFVTAVNTATLCGATDWRLPSATELLSIAHRGAVNPAIDTTYFPNTISSNYWSSSPYAGFSSHAWFVNFNDGRVFADFKSFFDGFPVRLVRAGQ